MAKQTIKQRKAIRSAAAKKGWDTRIARERREIAAREDHAEHCAQIIAERLERQSHHREMWSGDIGCWAWGRDLNICFEEHQLLQPSLWQRIKRWFA